MENESDFIKEMFCELCKKKERKRSAEGFCVTCVRYFCSDCLFYHTEFLPDHVCQNKDAMPQDVCLEACPSHSTEIIKFYCSPCDKFFCDACKKEHHGSCSDVGHLPIIVQKLEEKEEYKTFQDKLSDILSDVNQIESIVKQDKVLVEETSKKALSQIEATRMKLLESLEERFNELKKKVKSTKDKDENDIETDLSKLTTFKEILSGTQDDIARKSRDTRRCDVFMAMKEAESKMRSYQNEMTEIKGRNIQTYALQMREYIIFDENVQLGKFQFEVYRRLDKFQRSDREERNKSRNIHDVVTEKEVIAKQLQQPLVKCDTWYVVDIKWFKQWKLYVGYDGGTLPNCSYFPGPIDNTSLLQEGTMKLKEHLIVDVHFILLPKDGWNNVVRWYGLLEDQEPLPRHVIHAGMYFKSLKVEVYLWRLKLTNHNEDRHVMKEFSRSDTIGQLEKTMRDLFMISPEKEVRILNRYRANKYKQLTDKEMTIEDSRLYEGCEIVIETRNCDLTWNIKIKKRKYVHFND